MSTRPSTPTQLQLPLDRPAPARSGPRPRPRTAGRGRASGRVPRPTPVSPARTVGDDPGRLDEQTRQIGREGIAAARARLAAAGPRAERSAGVHLTEGTGPEDQGLSGHAA